MAKDERYRLQTLVELRENRKEEAERYLGGCVRALREEEERLATMQKELERMIAHREAKRREYSEQAMRGEMSAQGAISAEHYIKKLQELELAQEESIEGQHEVIQQRQEDVDDARKDLILRNQELKALEKHKEKWQAAVRKEMLTQEENEMDEIAQTTFRNKDR